jgi:hypothetical protein
VALVPSAEFDIYALARMPRQQARINMEKPTVRGPSPGRKAVHALGAKLNRKPKRPPPLPSKKNVSNAVRLVNR